MIMNLISSRNEENDVHLLIYDKNNLYNKIADISNLNSFFAPQYLYQRTDIRSVNSKSTLIANVYPLFETITNHMWRIISQ
jgi:hypothetical protein